MLEELRIRDLGVITDATLPFGPGLSVVTGETGGDDALLRSFGDEAVGLYSACPYTLDLETDGNKRFNQLLRKYIE